MPSILKSIIIILLFVAIVNTASSQDTIYNAVIQQLYSIEDADQQYRNQVDDVINKYGRDSKEIKEIFKKMQSADSANLIAVESIIQKHGWLGYEQIGAQANAVFFLVIQHSNFNTWKKYFPIMKAAVKNGKARAADLALLQDRLYLNEGKKQIYGSQIIWSTVNNKYFVLPIEDPDHVDKRRVEVGLQPLAEYINYFGMKWDVLQYKKDLPLIMTEWEKMPH